MYIFARNNDCEVLIRIEVFVSGLHANNYKISSADSQWVETEYEFIFTNLELSRWKW